MTNASSRVPEHKQVSNEFLTMVNNTNINTCRAMACDIHRGESEACHVCLLHQHEISGILRSMLQGRTRRETLQLASQSHSQRIRDGQKPLSGHEIAEERVQDGDPAATIRSWWWWWSLYCQWKTVGYARKASFI